MKGSSRSIVVRAGVATAFAAAFLTGALAIFGTAALAGAALRVSGLPFAWRAGVAAAALGALGLVNLLAVKQDRYCPLGLRRQTPRALIYRHTAPVVAAAWGLDTGLAVTTIRVAAITWGALVMTALGISAWWAGLGYGLGFVAPVLASILTQAPDGPSHPQPGLGLGSRLEQLLGRRAVAQRVSALLQFSAAAVLLLAVSPA